jgi:hypothetical protein
MLNLGDFFVGRVTVDGQRIIGRQFIVGRQLVVGVKRHQDDFDRVRR